MSSTLSEVIVCKSGACERHRRHFRPESVIPPLMWRVSKDGALVLVGEEPVEIWRVAGAAKVAELASPDPAYACGGGLFLTDDRLVAEGRACGDPVCNPWIGDARTGRFVAWLGGSRRSMWFEGATLHAIPIEGDIWAFDFTLLDSGSTGRAMVALQDIRTGKTLRVIDPNDSRGKRLMAHLPPCPPDRSDKPGSTP
jgi:hypothetical protein